MFVLWNLGQHIDIWTRKKMFSVGSLYYSCVACQLFFVMTASRIAGQCCQTHCFLCSATAKSEDEVLTMLGLLNFQNIDTLQKQRRRRSKNKLREMSKLSHSHLLNSNVYWSCLTYYVLAVLFSLSAAQEPHALKARPRSRYRFHFCFKIRCALPWC